MERCGISLPQRILQDACQKTGAKLDRSSVNYTVSGNLEVVARTMNEVHGVDWTEISIRQQQQPGSGLYAVGNDISDSDTNKDEQRQSTANPPAARQRRLKVEVADVSNTEYEKMWQTEANQKQEKNKPERRLKQLNTGGSEEAAVGPADDMHSSAVMPANRTGHVDRRVVLLPTVKHHHIINHFNRDISSLMDRCSSFNVQEDNDDTKWTFMARSVEELSNIQTELIKIVSRLTMEDVRIPSSLDMSMVKQVIQMNKYSGSVTIDVNEHTRLCLICGNDTAEVAHTKEWLEHTLSCQTYFPSQYRKPTDSVNDHHDVKTSHAGVRCDFVVGMSEYGNTLEFTTSSGTTVHIHQADMLRQQTEVIVNSANNQLGHHGGLARAILTAGGPVIDAESRSIIASRGALNTGDVVHTSAGNIPAPVRYVIHAVPPSGHQMETGSQQQGMDALIRTFLGSLQYANDKLKVASISLPPFGAGKCHMIPTNVVIYSHLELLCHSHSPTWLDCDCGTVVIIWHL